jgi:hypothetical protein
MSLDNALHEWLKNQVKVHIKNNMEYIEKNEIDETKIYDIDDNNIYLGDFQLYQLYYHYMTYDMKKKALGKLDFRRFLKRTYNISWHQLYKTYYIGSRQTITTYPRFKLSYEDYLIHFT